ncbi:MAG: ATP-dependent Clp protease proteolytic subunit [Solirubrobacteraceae bacterium]
METIPAEARETFSEEIWPETSEALVRSITYYANCGIERVVLDLSSPGGEVASGIELYKTLSMMPIELVTRNTGEVSSMGNAVFLAGDIRLAFPDTTFLLHPIKIEVAGGRVLDLDHLGVERAKLERAGGPSSDLRELDLGHIRLERDEREMRTIIEERTNMSGAEIRKLVREAVPIDALSARSMGIVHEIVPVDSDA